MTDQPIHNTMREMGIRGDSPASAPVTPNPDICPKCGENHHATRALRSALDSGELLAKERDDDGGQDDEAEGRQRDDPADDRPSDDGPDLPRAHDESVSDGGASLTARRGRSLDQFIADKEADNPEFTAAREAARAKIATLCPHMIPATECRVVGCTGPAFAQALSLAEADGLAVLLTKVATGMVVGGDLRNLRHAELFADALVAEGVRGPADPEVAALVLVVSRLVHRTPFLPAVGGISAILSFEQMDESKAALKPFEKDFGR